MCFPPGTRPPDIPDDLRPITGGAGGEDTVLTSADGATFRAFNRWLEEDWGFAYEGRIFASPYISLANLDVAVAELEWAIERGARHVVMRPAAVFHDWMTPPRSFEMMASSEDSTMAAR